MKDIKFKGIQEARNTYNTEYNAVRIYFDYEEECFYTFVYPDLNSWEEFNDPNVKEVLTRNASYFGFGKTTYDELKELVLALR